MAARTAQVVAQAGAAVVYYRQYAWQCATAAAGQAGALPGATA